jgi:DNA-binding winged helix-turn-helix (wHTH) protein
MTAADRTGGGEHAQRTLGPFELDVAMNELRRDGVIVEIDRKPLELLSYLARHRERVVSKRELLEAIWPGVFVSEQALSSAVRDLRRALGDRDPEHRMVETHRGRGFRLSARLFEQLPADADAEALASEDLIDRDDVLRRLHATLQKALVGETGVSLLLGAPGTGKTAVARQVVRFAQARSVATIWAQCDETDEAAPFGPWVQLLRACLRDRGSLDASSPTIEASDPIGRLLPELASQPAGSPHRVALLDGALEQGALFASVEALVRREAERRALLIVIDDLQWADRASVSLLEHLVSQLRDARVHLVMTARSSEVVPDASLARLIGKVARRARADHIQLEGLKQESVALLLRRTVGSEPPPAVAKAVHDATGGNPFFVAEVAQLLLRDRSAIGRTEWSVPLPRRVRDAIRLHFRARSKPCLEVLQVASALGREFEVTVLAEAVQQSSHEILSLLDEAEMACLVQAVRGRPGVYAFAHDLTREALYAELSGRERLLAHARIAGALEVLSRGDPNERLEELAFHYAEAAPSGPACKAVYYARRAAERALGLMAYDAAVAQYERALAASALDRDANPREHCEMALAQAETMWATRAPAGDVHQRFERAAELADSIDSADLLARAALGRCGHAALTGPRLGVVDEVVIGLLERARARLAGGCARLRAPVLGRLALATWYQRGFAVADTLSAEAVEVARTLGDPEILAHVLHCRHEVLWGPDFVQQRCDIAQEAIELARAVRSTILEIDGLYLRSRDRFERCDLAAAAADGARATELSRTLRHAGSLYRAGTVEVMLLMNTGGFDEARARIDALFERDHARNLDSEGTRMVQLTTLAMWQGRYQEVRDALSVPDAIPRRTPWTRCTRMRAHALFGECEAARLSFDELATDDFAALPKDHSYTYYLAAMAEVAVLLRDRERGQRVYDLLRPYGELLIVPLLATTCEGGVARWLGALAGLLGRFDEAELWFHAALTFPASATSAPLRAMLLLEYARMLTWRHRPSDLERARDAAAEAYAIASKLGMRGVAQCAANLVPVDSLALAASRTV